MADQTFGVKVTPDVKEKIDEMIKSSDFTTNKEWFEHILAVYEMQQLKQQDSTKKYSDDLNAIEHNLSRIQEIIIAMLKKTSDELSDNQAEWDKISTSLQDTLKESELRIKSLENELAERKTQIDRLVKDQQGIDKKIDALEALNSTYKKNLEEKENDNIQLKEQLRNISSINHTETIQQLNDEISKLKLKELEMRHQFELEVEKIKTAVAEEKVQFLLTQTEKPEQKKRGRPPGKKEAETQKSLQQDNGDNNDDNEDEDEEFDLPDDPHDLEELVGGEPTKLIE